MIEQAYCAPVPPTYAQSVYMHTVWFTDLCQHCTKVNVQTYALTCFSD